MYDKKRLKDYEIQSILNSVLVICLDVSRPGDFHAWNYRQLVTLFSQSKEEGRSGANNTCDWIYKQGPYHWTTLPYLQHYNNMMQNLGMTLA